MSSCDLVLAFMFISVLAAVTDHHDKKLSHHHQPSCPNPAIFRDGVFLFPRSHRKHPKRRHVRYFDLTRVLKTMEWPSTESRISDNFNPDLVATHIDAPSYMIQGGWTVNEIPLHRLVSLPAVKYDVRSLRRVRKTGRITKMDMVTLSSRYGPPERNGVLLLQTFKPIPQDNSDTKLMERLICFTKSAIDWLLSCSNNIVAIGLDAMFKSCGDSHTSSFLGYHVNLARLNKLYLVNNLHSLKRLPTRYFSLTIVPVPGNLTLGAPARVFAELALRTRFH